MPFKRHDTGNHPYCASVVSLMARPLAPAEE
jgi:hypothetical protein